jgi:nicotinamide riboside kinase
MAEPRAVFIAIVGAESTGKTTLAQALATALAAQTGRRVAWVPEVLREWCERVGRTPQAHEQAPILRAQHERVDAAAAAHDIVVCDTTALMTAVYSTLIFGDRSLDARAIELHRRMAFTLLTATDLPWVADGHQRDGPQVREPVDRALRERLLAAGLPFAVISGTGSERLEQALAALRPLWQEPGGAQPGGLFTRLAAPHANAAGRWACTCCDVSENERAVRAQRKAQAADSTPSPASTASTRSAPSATDSAAVSSRSSGASGGS